MSTRSIIARATGEGTFTGVYHHWDGYPNGGLGSYLVELFAGHFKNDLPKMLEVILDQHNAWSTIVNKDFSLKPGYTADRKHPDCGNPNYEEEMKKYRAHPDYNRPQCYCHGVRKEKNEPFTEKTDCWAEWAYVFETVPAHDDEPEKRILHVLYPTKNEAKELAWQEAGRIDLDSTDKIDWEHIECGENFERCTHYAWKHFPQLRDKCNLGTQKFLGREPMEMRDAIGFIINGKRVKATGCGGNSDYLRRFQRVPPLPPDTWIETVVYKNGKRADVPVALRGPEGETPYPGVQWVFPPTSVNPKETVRG